jgi:hypothetical protein
MYDKNDRAGKSLKDSELAPMIRLNISETYQACRQAISVKDTVAL